MSYTPTLSPVPHPRVVAKQKVTNQNKTSFTQAKTEAKAYVPLSNSTSPTVLSDSKTYDFPFGFVIVILIFLFILAKTNKKKHNDTDYTGIQMYPTHTLDPVRRRYTGRV
jgi:hypothetical protein